MTIKPPPVFRRYMLFQLPGWGIAIVVLSGLVEIWDVSFVFAASLFALWILKDLVLYPFVKVAYQPSGRGINGSDAMLGALGVAQEDLDPEGYVKIGSELWGACTAKDEPILKGTTVRVLQVRGLVVVVEAAGADEEH